MALITQAVTFGVFLFFPALFIWAVWILIYNTFLHPLSHYPGSRLAAVTRLLYVYHFVRGDIVSWLDNQHHQYGEVVRIEPNRLSYISPEAWKDIYGHATATHKANAKDGHHTKQLFSNGVYSLSSAHGPAHQRLRRIFSHAFSDRALRQQEPMLSRYADQLVSLVGRALASPDRAPSSLHAEGAGREEEEGVVLDAVRLFNYATFDVMADLAFGESLAMLDKGGYHPWVEALMASFKIMVVKSTLQSLPAVSYLWHLSQPTQTKKKAALHVESTHDRVTRRLAKGAGARNDIWGFVLRAKGPNGQPVVLTRTEMDNNANNL